jgi:Na+-transporting NADH:ubiquinone oxidoreductase subunit A
VPLATSKESLDAYKRARTGQLRVDGGISARFEQARFKRADASVAPGQIKHPLTQWGRRLTDIQVQQGQAVQADQLLARSESLELRASLPGKIAEIVPSKRRAKGHILIQADGKKQSKPRAESKPLGKDAPVNEMRRFAREKGIWPEILAGMEMLPPRPDDEPKAIVVRCVYAEPYVARGSDIIGDDVDAFTNGLEFLSRLGGGYAPIWLTFPDYAGQLGQTIRERLRGRAFVRTVTVPVRYPVENPLLLSTLLGQAHDWGPDHFWVLDPQAVIALWRAFDSGQAWHSRTVAVSGPAVEAPALVEAPLGTPLLELVKDHVGGVDVDTCCILRGGLYLGQRADKNDGLEYGDRSIVVIPEDEGPELFGWLNPGLDRHSWTNAYVSSLTRPVFRAKSLLRGAKRPCVQCGFCHQACPVGLYPHQLHRLITLELLDEAEQMGLLNCVECNSCAYGCVSKLDLARDIVLARRKVLREE